MITITCDDCERQLEVEDHLAGGKVECPHCGDVNRVPGASEPEAAPVAPAAAAIPVAAAGAVPDDAAEGPERVLTTVRPAMFRAHPFRYTILVVLFLAGAGGAIGSAVSAAVPAWVLWPGLVVAAAMALWWAWWWFSTTFWMRMEITNKRTVRYAGFIQRHSTEVLHNHVRSVDINQTFLRRIFGVGDIGIDSAGQDGIEIEVKDIPPAVRAQEADRPVSADVRLTAGQ